MTRLDNSVWRLNLYSYLTELIWIESVTFKTKIMPPKIKEKLSNNNNFIG